MIPPMTKLTVERPDLRAGLPAGVAHAPGRLGAVERVRREVGGERGQQHPVVRSGSGRGCRSPRRPGAAARSSDVSATAPGRSASPKRLGSQTKPGRPRRRRRPRARLRPASGRKPPAPAQPGLGQRRVGLLRQLRDGAQRHRAVGGPHALQHGLARRGRRRSERRPPGARRRRRPPAPGRRRARPRAVRRPRAPRRRGLGDGARRHACSRPASVDAVWVTSSARSSAVTTVSATDAVGARGRARGDDRDPAVGGAAAQGQRREVGVGRDDDELVVLRGRGERVDGVEHEVDVGAALALLGQRRAVDHLEAGAREVGPELREPDGLR